MARAIDRAEAVGLGVALVAHVALFGLLSLQFAPDPLKFENPPMAVDIIADTAPVSTAPVVSDAPPAARLGEPDADDAPPPPPALPKVEPRRPDPPLRRPVAERPPPPRPNTDRPPPPQRSAAPQRTATPPRQPSTAASTTRPQRPARDVRPTGDLDGIAAGVARDAQRNARATTPPAVQTAAEIRADIRVSINSEVRGPWNSCRVTGLDVDQLRTTIVFRLTQSGGLDRLVSVNTAGVTDSNRPQVARFEECARRAIQLAAPFANLPAEHYSYWQTYTLDFDKR